MNEEETKIADSMILFNELPECLPDDSKERVCLVFFYGLTFLIVRTDVLIIFAVVQ